MNQIILKLLSHLGLTETVSCFKCEYCHKETQKFPQNLNVRPENYGYKMYGHTILCPDCGEKLGEKFSTAKGDEARALQGVPPVSDFEKFGKYADKAFINEGSGKVTIVCYGCSPLCTQSLKHRLQFTRWRPCKNIK